MSGRLRSCNQCVIIWLILLATLLFCPFLMAQNSSLQRSRATIFKPRQTQNESPAVLKMRVEEGTVTAEIANSPLHSVLQELAERTGIIFEVRYPDSSLVSLRLNCVPLAEAIQRIAADCNTIFFYSRNVEQPEDIILVRVFPRGNPSLQPSIAYLGTGEVTKRNDTIVTSEQAFSALRESASIEEREKAVEFLVAGNSGNSTNGDDVIQALTAAISDTAPEIRVAAIEGLAAIEARGALAAILKSLRDSHPEVRRSAAMAVAAIGNAEDIGDLELLSTDEDAGVAAAAEMAITRLSATAKKVN